MQLFLALFANILFCTGVFSLNDAISAFVNEEDKKQDPPPLLEEELNGVGTTPGDFSLEVNVQILDAYD